MKRQIKGCIEHIASRFGPHRFGSGGPRLWVLTYHRILPTDDPRYSAEEPGMIVTLETFRSHLHQLKDLFTIIPLSEWVSRVKNNNLPRSGNFCAITFDDGWTDNFEYALPILVDEQVPATLFAVSHMIGTTQQFWPNRLAHLLANLPLGARIDWLEQAGYIPNLPIDSNTTARLILNCKIMSDDTLHRLIDDTAERIGLQPPSLPSLMSWDQLNAMRSSGLVEIGSHTCHHYRLVDNLPLDLIEREIRESKQLLEERLDTMVSMFCYPNGIASNAAVKAVSQVYESAVTTDRGINNSSDSLFELKRVLVHEDVSNSPRRLGARLSTWM